MPIASSLGAFLDFGDDFDKRDPEKWFKKHAQSGKLVMPSSFPSVAQVEMEAKTRATKILSSYDTLNQILDRHEETIRKRWLKKTMKQKKAILVGAWPNMAPSHRPDFEALKREEMAGRPGGVTMFREWFLWPAINLEDLSLKRNLLYFLHGRGRNLPGTFARSDFNRTGIAHASGAVGMAFISEQTMFLDGRTPTKYGRLVSWEDDPEALKALRSGQAFSMDPGHGLLTLEIQERIMEFLVECCKGILHGLSDSGSLTDSQFPVQDALPALITNASDYPTTLGLTIERQYRAPSVFDYQRMRSIIGAKRGEAEDHIWSLREDPSYFADTILEWSEHRRERLLDTKGRDHPVGPKITQNHALFWERVLAHAIANSYASLINWNIIERQLMLLERLQEKYAGAISPQRQLPYEYLQAFLTFRQMIDEAKRRTMTNLENSVPSSPPLRPHYVRLPQDPNSTLIAIEERHSENRGDLIFLLQILWDPVATHQFGLADVLDQLEHLVIKNPDQKARLSTQVSDFIADLGLFAQLRDELDNYQPWAAGMDYEFSKVHEKIRKEVFEQFNARQVIDNNMKYVSTGLESLGAPIGWGSGERRFFYPAEKKRTKENTEAMREAERNLDDFWAKFDSKYKFKVGKTINEIVDGFLFESRKLKRTPEWVEPTSVVPRKKKQEALETSFSRFDLTTDEDSNPSNISSRPKPKIKSKGVASSMKDDVAEPDQQHIDEEDLQPTFIVDQRAQKVFKNLFFTPNLNATPGEIPWVDFLHAMASTGFSPEKLYGSVWQFTPTRLDVERSIHFHEPHPHSKIPFKIARCMGRRLNRAYGWHSSMFVTT